jgi:hypothetical protein
MVLKADTESMDHTDTRECPEIHGLDPIPFHHESCPLLPREHTHVLTEGPRQEPPHCSMYVVEALRSLSPSLFSHGLP